MFGVRSVSVRALVTGVLSGSVQSWMLVVCTVYALPDAGDKEQVDTTLTSRLPAWLRYQSEN